MRSLAELAEELFRISQEFVSQAAAVAAAPAAVAAAAALWSV